MRENTLNLLRQQGRVLDAGWFAPLLLGLVSCTYSSSMGPPTGSDLAVRDVLFVARRAPECQGYETVDLSWYRQSPALDCRQSEHWRGIVYFGHTHPMG